MIYWISHDIFLILFYFPGDFDSFQLLIMIQLERV